MANPSPHKARQARKRRSKPGNLEALKRDLWHVLQAALRVLDAPDTTPELTLRAVHAMAQAAGQYARLIEVGELEARLAALESA